MDVEPVSETLPETYRRVLDRIADLEAAGYRREADLVRRDAIAAYSRQWDQRTSTRLDRLSERAERVLDGRERARTPRRSGRTTVAIWLALSPARARTRLTARITRRRDHRAAGATLEQPLA